MSGDEPWVSGYAQARDRLADQERCQALTGLRDEVLVPGVELALLREAVARWLHDGYGRASWDMLSGYSRDHWFAAADRLLTLPELRAALDNQP